MPVVPVTVIERAEAVAFVNSQKTPDSVDERVGTEIELNPVFVSRNKDELVTAVNAKDVAVTAVTIRRYSVGRMRRMFDAAPT
jgi:hypothetical protein